MSKAPAVDYALKIVEVLASSGQNLGISDISTLLGINKNAVSRILEALLEGGWLYCADEAGKKYALTVRPFALLSKGAEARSPLAQAAPIVRALHEQTGDSTYFGVLDGDAVMYLLHHDAVHDLRIGGRVGGRYPLHCTAPGKVILAGLDDAACRACFDAAPAARTANTITTYGAFITERNAIRKQLYAIDCEEYGKGIICVAAPVFGADGGVVGSVGVSTATVYRDETALVQNEAVKVVAAAAEITAVLGGVMSYG